MRNLEPLTLLFLILLIIPIAFSISALIIQFAVGLIGYDITFLQAIGVSIMISMLKGVVHVKS